MKTTSNSKSAKPAKATHKSSKPATPAESDEARALRMRKATDEFNKRGAMRGLTDTLIWPGFGGVGMREATVQMIDAVRFLMGVATDPYADYHAANNAETIKEILTSDPVETRLERAKPWCRMLEWHDRELTSRLVADLLFQFVRVWPGDKNVAPALRTLYRDKTSGFAKRWNDLVRHSKKGRGPNPSAKQMVIAVYEESELGKNSRLYPNGDGFGERVVDPEIMQRITSFIQRHVPNASSSDMNERARLSRQVHRAKIEHFRDYFGSVIEPSARQRFEASGKKYTVRIKDSMVRCLEARLLKEDV